MEAEIADKAEVKKVAKAKKFAEKQARKKKRAEVRMKKKMRAKAKEEKKKKKVSCQDESSSSSSSSSTSSLSANSSSGSSAVVVAKKRRKVREPWGAHDTAQVVEGDALFNQRNPWRAILDWGSSGGKEWENKNMTADMLKNKIHNLNATAAKKRKIERAGKGKGKEQ